MKYHAWFCTCHPLWLLLLSGRATIVAGEEVKAELQHELMKYDSLQVPTAPITSPPLVPPLLRRRQRRLYSASLLQPENHDKNELAARSFHRLRFLAQDDNDSNALSCQVDSSGNFGILTGSKPRFVTYYYQLATTPTTYSGGGGGGNGNVPPDEKGAVTFGLNQSVEESEILPLIKRNIINGILSFLFACSTTTTTTGNNASTVIITALNENVSGLSMSLQDQIISFPCLIDDNELSSSSSLCFTVEGRMVVFITSSTFDTAQTQALIRPLVELYMQSSAGRAQLLQLDNRILRLFYVQEENGQISLPATTTTAPPPATTTTTISEATISTTTTTTPATATQSLFTASPTTTAPEMTTTTTTPTSSPVLNNDDGAKTNSMDQNKNNAATSGDDGSSVFDDWWIWLLVVGIGVVLGYCVCIACIWAIGRRRVTTSQKMNRGGYAGGRSRYDNHHLDDDSNAPPPEAAPTTNKSMRQALRDNYTGIQQDDQHEFVVVQEGDNNDKEKHDGVDIDLNNDGKAFNNGDLRSSFEYKGDDDEKREVTEMYELDEDDFTETVLEDNRKDRGRDHDDGDYKDFHHSIHGQVEEVDDEEIEEEEVVAEEEEVFEGEVESVPENDNEESLLYQSNKEHNKNYHGHF